MKARVLVVDDNPTNLKLASVVMEDAGYDVKQAVDAKQALEIINSHPPSLILLDIALPGMDGLTLAKNLKADERTSGIIIVAMTAFAMKGDDKKAIEAGCDAYITKPIDTRRLSAQVAELIEASAKTVTMEAWNRKKSVLRVLIVDDNPINLKLLQMTLESEGIETLKATDGLEALKILDQNPRVHGIVSDILMPNMDGYRLCYAVRHHPKYSALPFIVYSSTHISEQEKKMAMEAGANLFLEKPTPARAIVNHVIGSFSAPAPSKSNQSVLPDEISILKQYSELLIRKLEEAQTDLIESERKYRLVVENIPDASWTCDAEGKTIFVSPNIKQLYGFTPEEIYQTKGNGWFDRIHPDDAPNVRDAYGLLFMKKKTFSIECRLQNKGGQWIRVSIRAVQAYERNGVKEASGLIANITQRKIAEETLQAKVTELQEFKDMTVGREGRMLELKREVNALNKELGRKEPYDLTFKEEKV